MISDSHHTLARLWRIADAGEAAAAAVAASRGHCHLDSAVSSSLRYYPVRANAARYESGARVFGYP